METVTRQSPSRTATRWRALPLLVLAAAPMMVSTVTHAASLRLHLEPGATLMLAGPQREWFSPGGGAAGKLEIAWGLTSRTSLGVQLGVSYEAFTAGADPRGGEAISLLVGPRIQRGLFWADAAAGYVRTGPRNRVGFGATLGMELPFRGIGLGPFVAYRQVFQPDTATAAADARYLIAGVAVTFGRRPLAPLPPSLPPLTQAAPAPAPAPAPPPPVVREPEPDVDRDVVPVVDDTAPVYLKESFIEVGKAIHFETDRAKLRPDARAPLRDLVDFLRARTDLRRVLVAGFCDERGTAAYNQSLSERRAANVVRFLVRHGIRPERLTARGYGTADPVAIGRAPDSLARNRRVQFKVLQMTVQQGEKP
jgi:outer membrane protein OmpA-like peptidoglycan-associated protein